ncbi:MAG TPA: DoxX family protein [Polyangiaceae bacterium]|jgi:hypothetical protein
MTTPVASHSEIVAASDPTSSAPVVRATGSPSRSARYTGRALTGLATAFLLFDIVVKLIEHPMAVAANAELGYRQSSIFAIGVVELACLIAYLVPRSAVLGAVLWTGYLGGAIATHVRVGNPLFSHVLFPVYIAALIWGGLYLREPRLRALLPFRSAR